MRRIKVLGLFALAMFALAAASASPALASLPTLLITEGGLNVAPSEAKEATFEGTGGKGQLRTNIAEHETAIECTAVSILAALNSPRLGLFHLHFTGCVQGPKTTKPCETTGDASGVILVLGSWHLVYDKLGSGAALGIGALLLLERTHITCLAVINTLLLVSGLILGLVLPGANKLQKTFALDFKAVGLEQEDRTYYNEAGEPKIATLLTAIGEGEGHPSSDESENNEVTEVKYEAKTTVDVEVMG